jgi:hypothetical protein
MAYLPYAERVSSNGTREQPVDTGPHDPFAVDQEAALADLELAWSDGGYHAFSAGDGHWCAVSSAGEVLAGDTPDAPDRAIRAHWQAMQ